MDSDEFRVLVVCTGNINRSALGAALLRTWADWYLPTDVAARVVVTSAGLAAPAGRPMRSRTRVIAERLGADGRSHRAAQVDERAIGRADLVLAADVAHRDGVLGIVPSMLRSTFTIREAGGIAVRLGPSPVPASADELRARIAAFSRRRELGAADVGDITGPPVRSRRRAGAGGSAGAAREHGGCARARGAPRPHRRSGAAANSRSCGCSRPDPDWAAVLPGPARGLADVRAHHEVYLRVLAAAKV